ncbi:hypothetical protein ACTPEU_00100, partial [Clostridioides difficile]|uniref:hypothetical protein n=1 Tax=Clostridioides difficile TaxID=1496 RepID=UPI003F8CFD07
PKKHFSGAVDNDKVVCEITVWPQEDRKPEGKIIEILGQKGERPTKDIVIFNSLNMVIRVS